MNRREFLQCAAILVSGVNVSQPGFGLSEEQQTFLAGAPNYNTRPVDYLTQPQRRIIAAMAEVIIPRTDTPGAIDAGVPYFIELMAADWLNEQELAIFRSGIEDMESRIPREYGKSFDELTSEVQLQIMEALEDAASDSPWYEFGKVQREFVSDAPFICQLKELTIWGFFTSELGSTRVLRHNPMPMYFDGDMPLSPDESSWANGGL